MQYLGTHKKKARHKKASGMINEQKSEVMWKCKNNGWKGSSTEDKIKQKGSNLSTEKKSNMHTAVQQSTEMWELLTDHSRPSRQTSSTDNERQFISLK